MSKSANYNDKTKALNQTPKMEFSKRFLFLT